MPQELQLNAHFQAKPGKFGVPKRINKKSIKKSWHTYASELIWWCQMDIFLIELILKTSRT